MPLFVGHAESPWMPLARFALRWFLIGQALGILAYIALRCA